MTIEEQIKILKAYKDGKKIQRKCINTRILPWTDVPGKDHVFNFQDYEYRVKPKEIYRPYSMDEFKQVFIQEAFCKAPLVTSKQTSDMNYCIISFGRDTVTILHENGDRESLSYALMLNCFTWLDGRPFGVKEEERQK